jgi:hypothetical protein
MSYARVSQTVVRVPPVVRQTLFYGTGLSKKEIEE